MDCTHLLIVGMENLKLNFCLFVLELNMKFLERQWYFKGEALAKHLMGKCVKSKSARAEQECCLLVDK